MTERRARSHRRDGCHRRFLLTALSSALLAPCAWAGFDPSSTANVAVYWGQNSANQAASQARLSAYCDDARINIIPIAFFTGLKPLVVNFASATDSCTVIPGTQLYRCPEIEEDIKLCQAKGKTILLSIGGATYTQGGFASADEAAQVADTVWALFGALGSSSSSSDAHNGDDVILASSSDDDEHDNSNNSNNNNNRTAGNKKNINIDNRPFGTAVVDGFDFDLEAPGAGSNFASFANRLRARMDEAEAAAAAAGPHRGGQQSVVPKYLSAAPQCVYPDAAMGEMLGGAVGFDLVMVQFYNNWCGVANFRSSSSSSSHPSSAISASPSAPHRRRRSPRQRARPSTSETNSTIARQRNTDNNVDHEEEEEEEEEEQQQQQDDDPFNLAAWDAWARSPGPSRDRRVRVLVGVPGAPGAAGPGSYAPADRLGPVIAYSRRPGRFPSFGGVMAWDMSQVFLNPGFLDGVWASLVGAAAPAPASAPASAPPSSPAPVSAPAPAPAAVPRYGQCGGEGYNGPSQCQAPYTCQGSTWWKACT